METGCRCGAVRLKLTGEARFDVYCHCEDCQQAHGAAYRRSSAYPAEAVEVVAGEPVPMTVTRTPRMICGSCGTHLYVDVPGGMFRSVNAYLLPRESFKPQFHIYCAEAVLPVRDDLPHYKTMPAAWGGSDEVVDW